MLKKGLAVAVILLFIGVAFSIPTNANVSKSSLEPVLDIDVIEEDAEKSSEEDCGCEDNSRLDEGFPILCEIIFRLFSPLFFICFFLPFLPCLIVGVMYDIIGEILDCDWIPQKSIES